LEYRSRLNSQQNADSDQDSDADSNSDGIANWDYPTLRSPTEDEIGGMKDGNTDKWARVGNAINEAVDNVATIKVCFFSTIYILFHVRLQRQMSKPNNFKIILL
jgi:hypothetical protein